MKRFAAARAAVLALAIGASAQQPGPGDMPQEMVWVDRSGEVLGRVGSVQNSMFFPEVSPDGAYIAVSARDGEANDRDVWIHEVATGRKRAIAPAKGNDNFPLWAADGRSLIFTSTRGGDYDLYQALVDGDGGAELVLQMPGSQYPRALSRDGRSLIFTDATPTSRALMLLSISSGEKRPLLPATAAWADGARYSPDGRWVAWMSNPSGLWHVYVAPSSNPEAAVAISRDLAPGWAGGGGQVRWRADGKELFYVMGDALMALPFSGDAVPQPTSAKKLFSVGGFRGNFPDEAPWLTQYAATADGERFVLVRTVR
jgi:Tol biopolymer transport system component